MVTTRGQAEVRQAWRDFGLGMLRRAALSEQAEVAAGIAKERGKQTTEPEEEEEIKKKTRGQRARLG